MFDILHLCCCLWNPPHPLFFFPLISTKIPRCFSADCPPKLSQKAFICYSSVRARARANLMRLWRLKGTATTHSQAGRFHTISMHPNPKQNCSKFHPSQRTAVIVDSNAEKRGILYLLVSLNGFRQLGYHLATHTVVQDTFSLLSWGICSVLLLAVRLWKEASGQNKYF